MKKVYLTAIFTLLTFTAFTQTKTIVGIMPFNTTSSGNDNYYNRQNQTQSANIIAIQDAVSDAFLNAKRFTLVEREKMALIKGEKKTQQSDEFIDGSTVEQSKSMRFSIRIGEVNGITSSWIIIHTDSRLLRSSYLYGKLIN